MPVTVGDVRAVASALPRSHEAFVRNSVKFRVGQLVYVALSPDETTMGFAFPKDWREALVAGAPDKFHFPRQSDLRFNWVCVRLDKIDRHELRELVINAWEMCVPKKVAAAYRSSQPTDRRPVRSAGIRRDRTAG